MIMLRRASERHHLRLRRREVWFTFNPQDRADPLANGFGMLASLSENLLPPGARAPRHPLENAEIVTYVREGALAYEDSTGLSGVLLAGEFQHLTAGSGVSHSDANASRSHWVHVFQVQLRLPKAELESECEQKRFSVAERRGGLCLVASQSARQGSLAIHQDVSMYSALLEPGQHVIHELSQGRSAWLHVVEGEIALGENVLIKGDGAGIVTERAVSLTAWEESEILLLDLGRPRRKEVETPHWELADPALSRRSGATDSPLARW